VIRGDQRVFGGLSPLLGRKARREGGGARRRRGVAYKAGLVPPHPVPPLPRQGDARPRRRHLVEGLHVICRITKGRAPPSAFHLASSRAMAPPPTLYTSVGSIQREHEQVTRFLQVIYFTCAGAPAGLHAMYCFVPDREVTGAPVF